MSKQGGLDVEKLGPYVECSKYGTCRMNCVAKCNTLKLKDNKDNDAAERWRSKYGSRIRN